MNTISTKDHLPGRPISASTYTNHGCRCDSCRAMYSQYQRAGRARNGYAPSNRAQVKAQNAAVKWVRQNHPDVWRELYDAAYRAEMGGVS